MAIFLGQNGVLSMGNKTPVTILQETLQKRGLTPHYELLYNGTGTIDPVFKFQVYAADLSAIGDGRTKKEAKHDAAAALLKRMQVNKAVTESSDIKGTEEVDIASPYTGSIKQNFVGMLDEVCVNNRLPLPVFVPVREEGPPHARVFTMQCKVSGISETAVARTKKQAKHLASQHMIKRVEEILGDNFTPVAEKIPGNEDASEFYGETQNLKAIECGNIKPDFTMIISNMHNAFFWRTEELALPKEFEDLSLEPESFYEKRENPKEFLDNLLTDLGGMCRCYTFTRETLKEALCDVDKCCERFYWNEENSADEEESADETDEDSNFTAQQLNLPDFDLGDSEESTSASSDAEAVLLSDSTEEEASNTNKIQYSTLSKVESKSLCIFLNVQCLQGVWTFRGWGDSSEEATSAAAVQAIKFLRFLSIPSAIKSTDREVSS